MSIADGLRYERRIAAGETVSDICADEHVTRAYVWGARAAAARSGRPAWSIPDRKLLHVVSAARAEIAMSDDAARRHGR